VKATSFPPYLSIFPPFFESESLEFSRNTICCAIIIQSLRRHRLCRLNEKKRCAAQQSSKSWFGDRNLVEELEGVNKDVDDYLALMGRDFSLEEREII
jgi:hypothetical protein